MNLIKKNITPYLYITPVVMIVIFIYFYPIYNTIKDSLYRTSGTEELFVGLQNYNFIFRDNVFIISILNNFKLLAGIPVLLFLALFLATLLYEKIIGWQFFRIIALIPYIMSITAIGIVFEYFLSLNGILNDFFKSLNLNALAIDWLGNQKVAIFTILGVVIWGKLGFGVILFLARMLSVDTSIYDAAKVDGASWFRTLFSITIPQLTNVIFFYIIINVINFLAWMFNYIYVMTKGGPVNSTHVLEYYIYNTGVKYNQIGIASAAAFTLLLVSGIFIVFQYFARKRMSQMGEE